MNVDKMADMFQLSSKTADDLAQTGKSTGLAADEKRRQDKHENTSSSTTSKSSLAPSDSNAKQQPGSPQEITSPERVESSATAKCDPSSPLSWKATATQSISRKIEALIRKPSPEREAAVKRLKDLEEWLWVDACEWLFLQRIPFDLPRKGE